MLTMIKDLKTLSPMLPNVREPILGVSTGRTAGQAHVVDYAADYAAGYAAEDAPTMRH